MSKPPMRRTLPLLLLCLASGAVGATSAAPPATATEPTAAELTAQARAASTARRYDEAIALYTRLLERAPGDMDARLARGRAYAWARRWREAEVDLRAVTSASPGYADAWSALGDLYAWSGRPRDAVAAYDRWQALAPGQPEPLLARARAHRQAGDAAAARRDMDAAIALGASDPGPQAAAALDLARAGADELLGSGFRWSLQAEARYTDFSGDRRAWHENSATLRRRFVRGSIGIELLQAERFGDSDTAAAVDAYVDLWTRAYANVRLQHSGDGLLPDAWRAEVFQGVGRGWEVSAGIDQLRFDRSTADIYSVGLGRYAGDFYARVRSRHVPSSDSLSHQATLRWYYQGDADDYLEASAGTGRGEEEYRGLLVDEDSTTVGLNWMHHVQPRVGLKLGIRRVAGVVDETQVGAGVSLRW